MCVCCSNNSFYLLISLIGSKYNFQETVNPPKWIQSKSTGNEWFLGIQSGWSGAYRYHQVLCAGILTRNSAAIITFSAREKFRQTPASVGLSEADCDLQEVLQKMVEGNQIHIIVLFTIGLL